MDEYEDVLPTPSGTTTAAENSLMLRMFWLQLQVLITEVRVERLLKQCLNIVGGREGRERERERFILNKLKDLTNKEHNKQPFSFTT